MSQALIVVDVQKGFEDPVWGPRDNPACEENIAALIGTSRDRGDALVYVRHDSTQPGSPLFPGQSGNDLMDFVDGTPDLLVTKGVNSAFLGDPPLEPWLRDRGIGAITICGITTNHCCETTARMGGNLGFDVTFVIDATCTFDRATPDGDVIPAAEISRVTAANLHGEFARVVRTRDVV